MDAGDVNATNRLLHRWNCSPVLGEATVNEYVLLMFSLPLAEVSPIVVWPANLVYCALFNTLFSQEYVGMGRREGITRERFFVYSLVIATVYCRFLASPHYISRPSNAVAIPPSLPSRHHPPPGIRLPTGLPLHCSVDVYMGLLDSSK